MLALIFKAYHNKILDNEKQSFLNSTCGAIMIM